MMHPPSKTPLLLAVLAVVSACTLDSRMLGSKREAWTQMTPAGRGHWGYAAVAATADGGAVVVGDYNPGSVFSGPIGPATSAMVHGFAANGTQSWSTLVATDTRAETTLDDVAIAPDGTIIAVGNGANLIAVVESSERVDEVGMIFAFDPSGTLLWEQLVEDTTTLTAVVARADGSLVYGGGVASGNEIRLGSFSVDGVLGPQTRLMPSGPADTTAEVHDLVSLSDGRVAASIGRESTMVVGFDAALAEMWRHAIPDFPLDVRLTVADDGTLYTLVCYTGTPTGEQGLVNDRNRIEMLGPDGHVLGRMDGFEPSLRPSDLGVTEAGTIVLVGTDTRNSADLQIGVVAIDPETLETLWFDTAGRHGKEPYSEDGGSDLAFTPTGDVLVLGVYDDRHDHNWRAWLRKYTADGVEPE